MGAKDEGRERNVKFVFVSNALGSIEAQPFVPLDLMPYSVSKVECSLLAGKNRLQHKELIVFAVHSGWERTKMGNWRQAMRFVEMSEAPITLEEGLRAVEKLPACVEHLKSLVRVLMEKVPSGVGLNTQEKWCVHRIHRAQHLRHRNFGIGEERLKANRVTVLVCCFQVCQSAGTRRVGPIIDPQYNKRCF
jgi:hypothetical protein